MMDDAALDHGAGRAPVASPAQAAPAPAKPPRARVADAPLDDEGRSPPDQPGSGPMPPRERDYLAGFLQAGPSAASPAEPGGALYESVIAALREIYDPEIPVNIYDLGLIYGVEVSGEADVKVVMTLTTPHCPVAETMPGEVEMRVMSVPGVRDAEVAVTWDPAWDPSKMSDEARLELGML